MQAGALQPEALGPNASSSSASGKDFFNDEAFMARAEQLLDDPSRWSLTYAAMNPEERIRFGMASMVGIAKSAGTWRLCWKATFAAVCKDAGIEALLAQQWPRGEPFASLLIRIELNEVLAQLLQTEAGRNSLSQANDAGATPLHIAAEYRNAEAVKLILDVDDEGGTLRMRRNKHGEIPLHRAAAVGTDDIVGLLLSRKGREQRLARSMAGGLPLHFVSCFSGNSAVVKRLLEDVAQEQVTAQTYTFNGFPLHAAVTIRAVEVIKALLAVKDALLQQLTMRDAKGNGALDLAIRLKDVEVIALIEGAMKDLLSATTSGGAAALTTASGVATISSIASGVALARNDAPVPMTPVPMTPMPPLPTPAFDAHEPGTDDKF